MSVGLLLSLLFRGSAVVAKFGIAAVVSAWFGLAQFGELAVLISLSVIYSKLAGFGYYFYANREQAQGVARNEVVLAQYSLYALVNLLFAVIVFFLFYFFESFQFYFSPGLVCLVLVSEHLAHETHQSLLAGGRAAFANSMFCFRALGWLLLVLVVGSTSLRSMDVVVLCWAFVNWLSLGILFVVVWRESKVEWRFSSRVCLARWGEGFSVSMRYYLLALIGALSLHADRFVIAHFLGSRSVGIYSLLWSFANAIQTVVANSVHLGDLKSFLDDGKRGDVARLSRRVAGAARKSVLIVLSFSVVLYVVAYLGASMDSRLGLIVEWMPLFSLLVAGATAKILSDVVLQALYSLGRDSQVLNVGLAVFVGYCLVIVPAVVFFGASGAGFVFLMSAVVSASWYWRYVASSAVS